MSEREKTKLCYSKKKSTICLDYGSLYVTQAETGSLERHLKSSKTETMASCENFNLDTKRLPVSYFDVLIHLRKYLKSFSPSGWREQDTKQQKLKNSATVGDILCNHPFNKSDS